jgi:hypothetical protein
MHLVFSVNYAYTNPPITASNGKCSLSFGRNIIKSNKDSKGTEFCIQWSPLYHGLICSRTIKHAMMEIMQIQILNSTGVRLVVSVLCRRMNMLPPPTLISELPLSCISHIVKGTLSSRFTLRRSHSTGGETS